MLHRVIVCRQANRSASKSSLGLSSDPKLPDKSFSEINVPTGNLTQLAMCTGF
jgi:hypothetical protein